MKKREKAPEFPGLYTATLKLSGPQIKALLDRLGGNRYVEFNAGTGPFYTKPRPRKRGR